MKKFIIALFLFGFTQIVSANTPYPEVSCTNYGTQANSCNQCFEGTRLYPSETIGVTNLFDDFINRSPNNIVMWRDDGASYETQVLQSGVTFFTSNDLLRYPDSLMFYTASSGRNYAMFAPNTTTRFLESYPGRGFRLQSVTSGNRNAPAYKLTFKIKYFDFINGALATTAKQHNECVFYTIAWCGDGVIDTNRGETCDPKAPGQSEATCNPITCTPREQTPVCNPAKTGTQQSPVLSTDTLCNVGTASGFTATPSGTTINYTWSCNTSTAVNCSANYTPGTPTPGNFDLSIKKYAKSEDVFATIANNEEFNYTIVARNNGTGAVTNTTTVKDVLPNYITTRTLPYGNGWTCTVDASSSPTISGKAITCTYTGSIAPNQEFPVINVPVRATNAVFQPNGINNRAFVHNQDEAVGYRCFADNHTPVGNESECTEDRNNSDPASVNPPNPNGFDLRLRKYVNGNDNSSVPNSLNRVTYTFVVDNLGSSVATGTTEVTDTFPAGVTPNTVNGSGWNCTITGQSFRCDRTDTTGLPVGASYPTITVEATVTATTGVYKNVACLYNLLDPNIVAPYNPANGEYRVNNCNPAEVVVVPPNSFDLKIVKKVGNTSNPSSILDRNTVDRNNVDPNQNILVTTAGTGLTYTFDVTNLGPLAATGTTIVEDTLPEGITISSIPSNSGWTCSISNTVTNASFICSRTDASGLPVGHSYPTITVLATIKASATTGIYSNTATLTNTGDTNPRNNTDPANVQVIVGVPSCGAVSTSNVGNVSPNTVVTYTCSAVNYTGSTSNLEYQINCGSGTGSWSSSNTGSCTAAGGYNTSIPVACGVRDKTNTGVTFSGSFQNSCLTTLTTGGGGGTSDNIYYSPNCVNNIPSCSSLGGTLAQCEAKYGVGKCYSSLSACDVVRSGLRCSDGGGSIGGSGCGNGVIQVGEECDVPGSTWCTNECKLNLWTNPGANPITDLWMTIPALSGTTRFASSPFMRTSFSSGVVIGMGGKVFTLADTVGFGIKTQYTIPLMIEADKTICLQAEDNSIIGDNVICTTFGEAVNMTSNNNVQTFIKLPGTQYQKKYILLGKGDYQYQHVVGGNYSGATSNSANDIDLFRGHIQYRTPAGNIGPTLNSAFQGKSTGRSNIALTLPESGIGLAYLPVRVSSAIVGTTGTPVNRSIESFVKTTPQSILAGFGIGIINSTTTTSTTTNSATTNTSIADISINGATEGSRSVSRFEDIPPLNGNPNIRAIIKGNLTIETCTNNTFVMTGVRTVIIEGNLILKCNMVYPSNDTTSSWAWIVKGGNIQVYNGTGSPNVGAVTNLQGVYVAIGSSASTGRFEPVGATTTNAILKIDGSLYGNAKPLFDSRLYARGTSAYDILTTGTIITYSNRALVNPPPLLSQYLNNYSVERVVK